MLPTVWPQTLRWSRLTWPQIHLLRTLNHRAAGQTGKHHGCHYLIHLNRLRTTKTRWKIKKKCSKSSLSTTILCTKCTVFQPLPVWSLSTSGSQLTPAVTSLPLLRADWYTVVKMVAFPQHFLCLDAVLCKNLYKEKKKWVRNWRNMIKPPILV